MPSFDVVSQVDFQEVRNALDQARREISTRFDFKGTDSSIDLNEHDHLIELHSNTEQKLQSLVQVLEEKLVRRQVPLKALAYGKIAEAAKGTVRQTVTLNVGISDDKAREINKFLKALSLKGVQSQVQGDQLRVSGKKKDDLQAAITALRGHDFDIPLQFSNFRE
jgi:cyclic-di-GMP-binding protein